MRLDNRGHIQSSAMGYAISFLLLIGLICSGVLFISSANKRLEMNYELSEHMLFNNYFGLRFGASMQHVGEKHILHPSGDTSVIVVKNWGAFRAVVSTTHHGNRSVEKSALVAFQMERKLPALYMPNRKQVVKLCGKTLIEGNAYLSKRGFERGHIAGKHFEGTRLLHGTLKESDRHLPELNLNIASLSLEDVLAFSEKIEPFTNDTSFKFTEQTRVLTTVDPLHIDHSIEGNIVLHSFDSIYVSATAALNHVILMAPVIRFEKGFRGCVQAIAERQISCEEDVWLAYPSALILTERKRDLSGVRSQVLIDKNAHILGGILLTSERRDFRNPVYLKINQAVVGGLVYNQGETELRGKIIGSLYTDKLALKIGGGQYSGYLCDATISSKQLPDEFVMPNWLKDEELSDQPMLLTCF